MKPVQYRIRIGRIVSDRPLGASFTESLHTELSAMLSGETSSRPASVEAHIANSVILTLSEAKGQDLTSAGRSPR